MSSEQDDLDLLLSLQDRVLETPPASPCNNLHTNSPDYLSDHGSPKRPMGKTDMSVFKDSVGDYLENVPSVVVDKNPKSNQSNKSNDVLVEKFSGLRIRKLLVSAEELSFSETRFIRLPAIRNMLSGETISGCWATAAILTENGSPRVSSTGKKYCIWKLGCLDEKLTSVFLFGDAYTKNCKESVGTVFALFNASVRKDAKSGGFSLSVFSSNQIAKMGTSVDYGVCKAKRKDGVSCNMVINKARGIHCAYHKSNASQKYSVTRTELKGGNAGKVTTNARSQGIRFLTELTGKTHPKDPSKRSTLLNKENCCSEKRLSSSMKPSSATVSNKHPEAKRRKTEEATEKMIEIELFSSDGE
ncbi:hypothetical protein IFM89_034064 [Coptis chinensis]|uniref:Protein MCM10 homolog n=1 Tax=Coptis chinensis TaxID=261450 RepID=A0A835IT02_9MAGN|nr:hypothetical protein IFM89_034064 [Coptis chinensis]